MLYSEKHNVVVYPTPIPERILNCVPQARQLTHESVVVPCRIKEMQVMRLLGYPAVSPILHDYTWPGRFKPFDHQKLSAAFATLHPRSFNLSDMGTGKTLSILWAADYLMEQGIIKKALILSPLSTIYRVWENEIFTHFMGKRTSSILYGTRQQRFKALAADADFYICNHDGLGVGTTRNGRSIVMGDLATAIKDRPDIDCIIVDEGSVYKDSGTNRYKVLRFICADKSYVWWLTGTPVPVDPTNAWAQARIVRKDYAESFINFRDRTMLKLTQFKYVARPGSYKLAADILQPAIRFERDECLDLPDVMIETRDVELSRAQQIAYDDLKKRLKTEIGAGQITAINEAALRLKLIQIACGAVYGPDHVAHRIDSSPRVDVLNEVIEEAGHKILIFAPLTSVINMLSTELSKKYSVEKITGDVSAGRRNEIFTAFQDKVDPRIIVADPRTMAHGLTLTRATTTIWYGPTDQPEIYQQANKRMDRPGQTHKMLIVRLAATPIEREIYKRLDNRDSMQGLLLDLVRGE